MDNDYGFLQRKRKERLIAKISTASYVSAPDYLKSDDDIIVALLKNSGSGILSLPKNKQEEYLIKQPDLITHFDVIFQKKFLISHPEGAQYINEQIVEDFIYENRMFNLIPFISVNLQTKLLTQTLERTRNLGWGNIDKGEISPGFFSEHLTLFNPQAIYAAYAIDFENKKGFLKESPRGNYRSEIANFDISVLPTIVQTNLAIIDNALLPKCSAEAIIDFVNGNPMLFNVLPSHHKAMVISTYPQLISLIRDYSEYSALAISLRENIQHLAPRQIVSFLYQNPTGLRGLTSEEMKRFFLIGKNAIGISVFNNVTDVFRDPQALIELGRFDADLIYIHAYNRDKMFAKLKHLIKMYCDHLGNYPQASNIVNYFNSIDVYNIPEIEKFIIEFNELPKLLLNNNIMNKCDSQLLLDYIKKPALNLLIDIIRQTYGDKAATIIEERPLITIDQIPSFDIFDQIAFDEFDLGVVHNCLSYKTEMAYVIGELVRQPQKMIKYKQYRSLTKDFYPRNNIGIADQLVSFMDLSPALEQIDLERISEEQKKNLFMILTDRYIYKSPNYTVALRNIDDLNNYQTKRTKMFDEALEKTSDVSQIKELIFQKHFGIQYDDSDSVFYTSKCSALEIIRHYNIQSFVKDKRTMESGRFSEDELDILELISIIDKITDPTILKAIFRTLDETLDLLNSNDFKEIFVKVPKLYSEKLINSLLTLDKAHEMFANNTPGITINEIEGVEVISLTGADFRLLIHTTMMNNSKLNIGGLDEYSLWNNFENGVSTVSACVIEPNLLASCGEEWDGINLGFSTLPPEQIIGMGPTDIFVDHRQRQIDPVFEYNRVSFEYPEELVRRTAAQINNTAGEQSDQSHPYNEVSFMRRAMYPEKITEDTKGGRIMPDYIVIYGKATSKHLDLARKFAKNDHPLPVIEIDVKAYGNRSYMRAHEGYNKETQERNQGRIITEIEEKVGIRL